MKRLKKILASALLGIGLLSINPIGADAAWKSNSTGWWYTEGNSWATGWRNIDGNWYYFYSDGYMAKDTTIDGCYLNSSGAWTTSVPSVSSTSTSNNTVVTNTVGSTVYVSNNGIYHKSSTAHNMKHSTAMSITDAQNAGYRACEAKSCS